MISCRFLDLSRQNSFPSRGVASRALSLSARFLCISQLDTKPQEQCCVCYCPARGFLALLRKVTLLFWRHGEPELSDTISGHSILMSPTQSGTAVGQEGSGLQAVGLPQSWLPAHTTRPPFSEAETLRPIWPLHCQAAEKSGSVPRPTSVPARELDRREGGVMAEPHRVDQNKASGAFQLKKSSASQTSHNGQLWSGKDVFTEQHSESICSWQQGQTWHQEHKSSVREYGFSNEVSGCFMAVPSPELCRDGAVLTGSLTHAGLSSGCHLSGSDTA